MTHCDIKDLGDSLPLLLTVTTWLQKLLTSCSQRRQQVRGGGSKASLLSKEISDPLELVGQSWELCPD